MTNSQAPLVSVITATYNWSSVLHYAIRSVLWQTFEDFEYLIIGDGCTDDSEDVVAAFNDPRLIWHNLPENTGSQSMPNNKGLEMARGKYIAYLGHDDIWYPTHLEKQVEVIERTGADLVHSLIQFSDLPGRPWKHILGGVRWSDQLRPILPPSCIMHRRSIVTKSGPWHISQELGDVLLDREFVLRIWEVSHHFECVPELTVFKCPSALRRNSYVDKPSHEQAALVERIATEPDFQYRELVEASIKAQESEARIDPLPASYTLRWLFRRQRRFIVKMVQTLVIWLKALFRPPGIDYELMREVRGFKRRKLRRPGLKILWRRLWDESQR